MWNFNKIKKSLNENGYYEFKNYLKKNELEKVKKSLVDTLNYIHPSKEKNLQKKYYEVKKYNNKLKGNWYDICKFNIDLLGFLHKKEMVNFVKKYFSSNVVFLEDQQSMHMTMQTIDCYTLIKKQISLQETL